jgi:hypothetical protein
MMVAVNSAGIAHTHDTCVDNNIKLWKAQQEALEAQAAAE